MAFSTVLTCFGFVGIVETSEKSQLNYVVALKALSMCSGHLDAELLRCFDEKKSNDSVCVREKLLHCTGFQNCETCDPIKDAKSTADLLSHVMASLWT